MTLKKVRTCPTCGSQFLPRVGNQRHCTRRCTDQAKAARQRIRRAGLLPAEQLPRCLVCGRAITASGGAVVCSEDCKRRRAAELKRSPPLKGQDPRLQVAQDGRMTDEQWQLVLQRVEAVSGPRTAALMLEQLNDRRARQGQPPLRQA